MYQLWLQRRKENWQFMTDLEWTMYDFYDSAVEPESLVKRMRTEDDPIYNSDLIQARLIVANPIGPACSGGIL